MPRDDEKMLRQLSLVSYLLGRERPSPATEIARCVEGYASMSRETFTRRFYSDRDDLRRGGIDIHTAPGVGEEGEEAYYLTNEDYAAQGIDLTPEETSALSLALGLLEKGFAYARPLRLAVANIIRGNPDPSPQELEHAAVSLHAGEEAREQGPALGRLDDAASRGKTVRFLYRSAAQTEPEERTVNPYSLFLIGGHWYMVGHDHVRNDIRMYRLNRITGRVSFQTTRPRDFHIPASYDPQEYTARPPWLLAEPVGTARFLVDEDLAWWVERTYRRVVRRETGSKGRAQFETEYADGGALVKWITGLGSRAELTEPQALRDQLRERLRQVRDAHRNTGEATAARRQEEGQREGGREL